MGCGGKAFIRLPGGKTENKIRGRRNGDQNGGDDWARRGVDTGGKPIDRSRASNLNLRTKDEGTELNVCGVDKSKLGYRGQEGFIIKPARKTRSGGCSKKKPIQGLTKKKK